MKIPDRHSASILQHLPETQSKVRWTRGPIAQQSGSSIRLMWRTDSKVSSISRMIVFKPLHYTRTRLSYFTHFRPGVTATIEDPDGCKYLKTGEVWISGGRGGNRTHNPRLRRPVLYPIELLARILSLQPYCNFE